MSAPLRPEAYQRITSAARARLQAIAAPPSATLPVSASGWESALRDADLASPRKLLDAELACLFAAPGPQELRLAATRLADATLALATDLWCLAAMSTPRAGNAV